MSDSGGARPSAASAPPTCPGATAASAPARRPGKRRAGAPPLCSSPCSWSPPAGGRCGACTARWPSSRSGASYRCPAGRAGRRRLRSAAAGAAQPADRPRGRGAALAAGDVIAARVAAAASRNLAWFTFGFAGALALLLVVVQFLIANDLAVSRTFFLLPLIANSFWLILKAFWTNVYIFCVAEVLVLVWGLVIAVARLAPGAPGKPIRVIATALCRCLPRPAGDHQHLSDRLRHAA